MTIKKRIKISGNIQFSGITKIFLQLNHDSRNELEQRQLFQCLSQEYDSIKQFLYVFFITLNS